MVFSWLTSWLANWRSCDPESEPPRLALMEKPCPSDTAVLESCGDGLLWQAACFTHVIRFRPCVKSFDQWVYREKKKKNHTLLCQLLGCEGHCLLSGMQNLGAEMYLTLAAEMCVVSECGGCEAAPPGSPPEFDTCLLRGKAASVSL